jgi:hypothetical protein
MGDEIEELRATMQRIDELLTRFELDMAARFHAVDYHAAIACLCEEFASRMRELQHSQVCGSGGSHQQS